MNLISILDVMIEIAIDIHSELKLKIEIGSQSRVTMTIYISIRSNPSRYMLALLLALILYRDQHQ